MNWVIALLLGLVGIGVACAAALGAFALAWDVSRTKFKKQLHGLTARYEAALMAATGGGGSGGRHGGGGGRRWAGPDGAGGDGGGAGGGGGGGVAAMYESFTMGWFNVVVQHLWLPMLEKFVSTIAAERLQIVLNEVLRKNSSKAPWRYLQSIAVEEVTFGLAPPQFQFCTAKYDPSRSYLLLTMNLHYHSSGFQAVLTPRVQFGGMKPFGLRLEIMQLHLAGKLHLGLHLSKEPPGIKGIDYSFASPPEFDIQASPVGYLNLRGELPGLINNLRSMLQRIINRRLVEPERRYLDLQRIYRNKHVQKVGGPGGCLRVCVIGGRNLMRPPPTAPTATASTANPTTTATTTGTVAPGGGGGGAVPPIAAAASGGGGGVGSASSASATDCDPYVELRFGREVFRTPIAHHTADPVFNWQFDIRLPADLPVPAPASAPPPSAPQGSEPAPPPPPPPPAGAEPVPLYFRVLNARTLGEPEVLSRGALDAAALGLEPNADPKPKLLELTAATGGSGGGGSWPRGTLSLQVSWLKALPKKVSPFPQDAARAAAAAAAAASAAAAAAAAAPATPVVTAATAATPVPVPMNRHSRSAVPSPYSYSPAATSTHITPLAPHQSTAAAAPSPLSGPDGGGRGVGRSYRGQHTDSSAAAAAALDLLTTRMQEVAGSAPMYGNTSGGADDSPFGGARRGAESYRSLGPVQHAPYSSLDDSMAGSRSYSRTTMEVNGAVRRGPHRGSLDSGSWQVLSADSTSLLNGIGGAAGAVRSIHVTANGSGGGAAGVVAAGTAAIPGIATPRESIDVANETGSASGVASSAPSCAAMPAVTGRPLKKNGLRGGGGGGGGGGGAGRVRSTGGGFGSADRRAATTSSAASAMASAVAAGPGKQRRAISGLLGKWSRRFSHGGAVPPPPTAAAAVAAEPRQRSHIDDRAATAVGASRAATAAAAMNAAVAAAAARASLDLQPTGSPLNPRGAAAEATATFCTAAAAAAAAGQRGVTAVATETPAPSLSPSPRDAEGHVARGGGGGAGGTASHVESSVVTTPAARLAPGSVAAAGASPLGGDVAVTSPLGPGPGPVPTGKEVEEVQQQELPPPADSIRTADLLPATPPQPNLPPRGSISPSPTPQPDEAAGGNGDDQGGDEGKQRWKQRRQGKTSEEGTVEAEVAGDRRQGGREGAAQPRGGPGPTASSPRWLSSSLTAMPSPGPELATPVPRKAPAAPARPSSPETPSAEVPLASPPASPLPLPLPLPLSPLPTANGSSSLASAFTSAAAATAANAAVSEAASQQAAASASSAGADLAQTCSGAAIGAAGASGAAASVSVGSLGRGQLQHPIQPDVSVISAVWAAPPAGSGSGTASGAASGGVSGADGSGSGVAGVAASGTGAVGTVGGGYSGSSCQAAGGWSSTFQSLAQVVRMQQLLQAERQSRSELHEMLSEVTRKYEAMVRLRRFENHRALVEGARFQLHLAGGVRRVLVWYNEARGVVQVDPDPGGGDQKPERAGGQELWPRAFAPQELERAERGSSGFPSPSAWDGVLSLILGRSMRGPPPPASLNSLRCFSLHLHLEGVGAARTLHLQLPASGNGRSRDEWVDALQDLAIRTSRAREQERASAGARQSNGLATTTPPTAAAAAAAAAAAGGAGPAAAVAPPGVAGGLAGGAAAGEGVWVAAAHGDGRATA